MLPQELVVEPVAAKVLDQGLVRLGGDVVTDDSGEIRYAFPRIRQELAAVVRAHAQAPATEDEPGEVVFSSRDRN